MAKPMATPTVSAPITMGTGFSRRNSSVRPRVEFGRICSRRRGRGSRTLGGRRRWRRAEAACSGASGSSFTKSSSTESTSMIRNCLVQRAGQNAPVRVLVRENMAQGIVTTTTLGKRREFRRSRQQTSPGRWKGSSPGNCASRSPQSVRLLERDSGRRHN